MQRRIFSHVFISCTARRHPSVCHDELQRPSGRIGQSLGCELYRPFLRRTPACFVHSPGGPGENHPAGYALVPVFRRLLRRPAGICQQLVRGDSRSSRYHLPVRRRAALYLRCHRSLRTFPCAKSPFQHKTHSLFSDDPCGDYPFKSVLIRAAVL